MNEDEQFTIGKNLPLNELDQYQMNIDPAYYDQELNRKFERIIAEEYDPVTNTTTRTVENTAPLFRIHTRNTRLANLKGSFVTQINEVEYAKVGLELGHDILLFGCPQAGQEILNSVNTMVEVSQGRNGFTRKTMTTSRVEKFESHDEPNKKGLFGNSKPKGDDN